MSRAAAEAKTILSVFVPTFGVSAGFSAEGPKVGFRGLGVQGCSGVFRGV